MDETTQAGGANAQAPDASNEGSQSSQSGAGVQARIDELTHFRRTAEADAAATRQLLASQQAEVQRLQELLAKPATKDDPEVDYSQLGDAGSLVKKAIDDAVRRTTETLSSQFQQQFKQLQSVQVQSQVSQYARQHGLPPDVEAHAQSVMVGATQRGIPMTYEDAVKWAVGEALMTGKMTPQQIRKPGPNSNVLTGPAPAPQPAQRQLAAMPANFEDMTPDQQQAWAAKNGYLDMPLD